MNAALNSSAETHQGPGQVSALLDAATEANHSGLRRYYRRHAPLYDATRWTFLFGRSRLLKMLADGPAPSRVLEVGCGTGRNLASLAERFPGASFTGVDLSDDMLAQARRRPLNAKTQFHWVKAVYDRPLNSSPQFDLVFFSYSLSMMNPGWEKALEAAAADLTPNGRIAAVDFHQTRLGWFRRWMWQHQVRMEGHLLPVLSRLFQPTLAGWESAYGGVWQYFSFLGTSRPSTNP
jgi:S-adenosylmethionine-diacylgycerolhomoserine-N-methlytransferase